MSVSLATLDGMVTEAFETLQAPDSTREQRLVAVHELQEYVDAMERINDIHRQQLLLAKADIARLDEVLAHVQRALHR